MNIQQVQEKGAFNVLRWIAMPMGAVLAGLLMQEIIDFFLVPFFHEDQLGWRVLSILLQTVLASAAFFAAALYIAPRKKLSVLKVLSVLAVMFMLLGFIFYVIGQPSFDTYIVYSASCIGTLTVIVMAYGILRSLKLK